MGKCMPTKWQPRQEECFGLQNMVVNQPAKSEDFFTPCSMRTKVCEYSYVPAKDYTEFSHDPVSSP